MRYELRPGTDTYYLSEVYRIDDDGTEHFVGWDDGDVEDRYLNRGLSWVVPELNSAYEAGVAAGKKAESNPAAMDLALAEAIKALRDELAKDDPKGPAIQHLADAVMTLVRARREFSYARPPEE